MKKLLFCLCALMLLSGCTFWGSAAPQDHSSVLEQEKEFKAIIKSVENLLAEKDLPEHEACTGNSDTAACYGFKPEALRDGWVLSSTYALEAFEIALFHAKSEANVTIIEEKLHTYLDDLEEKYASAAPQTAAVVRRAAIVSRGSFCALIVCDDALQTEVLAAINAEISD